MKETNWLESSKARALEMGEVHVWRAWLPKVSEDLAAKDLRILSTDELQRAARYHFERDRLRFVGARCALRQLLGKYLAKEPSAIELSYSEYGKPSVGSSASGPVLEFNIGHSDNLCLLAFCLVDPVGIDVERLRPLADMERVAKRFFAETEYNTWRALRPGDQIQGFFNCWTRKEAFIKAIGEGLSFPLNRFVVSLAPEDSARLFSVNQSEKQASKWNIVSIQSDLAFAAAMVVRNLGQAIHYFEYNRKAIGGA